MPVLNKVKTQMGGRQNRKRKNVVKDSHHSRSIKRRVRKEAKGIKGLPAFQVRQPQPMQVYRDIFTYTWQIEISLRMAYKLHASSSECSVSASDLFYELITQTSMEKGTWIDAHPIASVSYTRPTKFEFEGKNKSFINCANLRSMHNCVENGIHFQYLCGQSFKTITHLVFICIFQ